MTASLDRDWDNRWAGLGFDDDTPPADPVNGNQPGHTDPDQTSWADRLEGALLDTAGLDTIGDPIPLIRDVLQTDSLAWLAGRPGHAKTLIALDLAGCVGTGEHWQGHPVQQGEVLYLIAEGVRGIRQRVRAWETSMGRPMSDVIFLPVAVQSANTVQWKALCELAAKRRPALIVVDTQARVTVGMEENSSKDMGVFVDQLERLRRYSGACILTLHHTPRNSDNLRGSTAMEGAATTIIKAVKEGETVTLHNDPEEGGKQKDWEPFDTIHLRLIPTDSSVIVCRGSEAPASDLETHTVKTMLTRWWQWHGSDPVSVSVLVKSDVCSERTFHRHKIALVRAGLVAKEGKGNQVRYHLVRDPSS